MKPPPRIMIFQPALPSYRIGFFDRLRDSFGAGFSVVASESVIDAHRLSARPWEHRLARMMTLLPGLEWQQGVLGVPLRRGDIVVISGAPRCLSNLALLLKARLKGAHTIWWGHYWSATSRSWRAGLRLRLARLSDALLFYTDREAQLYLSRSGARKHKLVFALNNGIETDPIVRLRAPYDARTRGRRLLFIGRITEKSELPLLMRALAEPPCRDVTLHIIGTGQEEPRARALAAMLGVNDRIVWHGPTTDEDIIAEVANRCALFVYPGSVGLSLIHGLAYGLPAIVHDDPWTHMPEIAALENGKNGLLFRKGDGQSLAETIDSALSDVNRLERMSAAAIETTTRSYNASDMAERFCTAVAAVRK